MAIDTETKRRSVSGYSGIVIAPLADGTIGSLDWEHVAGLYAGIAAGEPVAPAESLPYLGDLTSYDSAGATGSISGATLLGADSIYDSAGATGSTSGATIRASDTNYG